MKTSNGMKKFFDSSLVKIAFVSLLLISFSGPLVASASVTVNAPTLNGTATVSVAPGATVAVVVSVTTTNSEDWESTSYRIGSSGSYSCVNTANFSNSGTNSATFNITAPSTAGTYNLEIRAHGSNYSTNDNCSTSMGGQIGSRTVSGAITVAEVPPQYGGLIVEKKIIGDGMPENFQFQVDAGTLTNFEADGNNEIRVTAGTHSVNEPAISGYTKSYSCTNLTISMGATTTCTITNTKTPNAISNPSLEQGAGDTATGWLADTNIAPPGTEYHIVPGRFSDRAAQVTVTAPAADSDAKWITPAVQVTAGQYYTFSLWYKSSVATQVDMIENDSNFSWVADLPASDDWARYETSFLVPAGVTSLQFAAIIDAAGTITTDDYQLVLGTAPLFDRGRVTLTFDDGFKSFLDNGVPALNTRGLKATAYVNGEPIQGSWDAYMLAADLLSLQSQGYDIGSHTMTHADLTLPTTNLNNEINGSRTYLQGLGLSPVDSLAYPYGSYNEETVIPQVKSAGFKGARTVDQGYNFTNTDPYKLKIQHVTNATTFNEVKGWIDSAISNKTWLIFLFHKIEINNSACVIDDDNNPQTPAVADEECATQALLQDTANYLASNNVCVLTMSQALNGAPCNQPPVLDLIADQSVAVNNTLTFTAHATDPNSSDVMSYTLSGAPSGASIDPVTGVFTWVTNLTNVGTTTATVVVSDGQGGTDSQVVKIEVLPDTVPPSVTISTSAAATTKLNPIPVSVLFSENVSGFDNTDDVAITNGTLDNLVATDGSHYSFSVIPAAEGEITVKILAGRALDSSNNPNLESNILSVVYDHTAPTIVLIGDAEINMTTADTYVEGGAVVTDIVNGVGVDISANLVIGGSVNTAVPGTYVLTYNGSDAAGNAASQVTRTIHVSDMSGPVINVPADMTVEAENASGKVVNYTLPTATDGVDGDVSSSVECLPVSGSTFPIGENTISCTAHDNAETPNTSAASFKIIVKDTTAPVITVPDKQTFEATGPLTTPVLVEATALDSVDASPVVTYSPHSFGVGTTTVTWTAKDLDNNESTATSEVVITDTGLPVIHLNGAAIVYTAINSTYVDLGATATDVVDGTVTVTNNALTSVDTSVEGIYEVTYSAVDTEGNAAEPVVRKVVVSDLNLLEEQSANTSYQNTTISWTTSHPSTSRVLWDTVSHATITDYGAPNYGYANSTVEDAALVTNHAVAISGLSADTVYYFRPVSHGSPEIIGDEVSVTTGTAPKPVQNLSANRGGGGGGGGRRAVATVATTTPAVGQVLGASTGFQFTRTLMVGMTGEDVMELQNRLTSEGVYSGPITGYFGIMTEAGVKAFQAKYGIEQAGIVGPKTRARLNEGGAVLGAQTVGGTMTIEQMKALLNQLQAQLNELLLKQKALLSVNN